MTKAAQFIASYKFLLTLFCYSIIFLFKNDYFVDISDQLFWILFPKQSHLLIVAIENSNTPVIQTIHTQVNLFINILLYILMLLILFVIYFHDIRPFLARFKQVSIHNHTFLIIACIFFFFQISGFLILTLLPLSPGQNQLRINALFSIYPFITSMLILLIAPLVEECIFRFCLQKLCTTYHLPIWFFYLVSISTFALIHTKTDISLFTITPYVIIGLLLTFTYEKTTNLWYSILLHMLNNLFSIIFLMI